LILDQKLDGKINQEKGTVEIDDRSDVERTQALQEWTSAIGSLCRTVMDEGDGFKTEDSQSLGGVSVGGLLSTGTRSNGSGAGGFGKTKGGRKNLGSAPRTSTLLK